MLDYLHVGVPSRRRDDDVDNSDVLERRVSSGREEQLDRLDREDGLTRLMLRRSGGPLRLRRWDLYCMTRGGKDVGRLSTCVVHVAPLHHYRR